MTSETSFTEIWKPVLDFEGRYEVSNNGRVRSCTFTRLQKHYDKYKKGFVFVPHTFRGRILQPWVTPSGHEQVVLGRSGGTKLVHVLVLEAFKGPRPKGYEACHKDDNGTHNTEKNLYWGTRSENLLDAVRNKKKSTGEQPQKAKLKNRDIPKIRKLLQTTRPPTIAKKFNVSANAIAQIEKGITWKKY